MNPIQQLALLYVMKSENEETADLEWERFKMMMVAHNPSEATNILKALDSSREEQQQPQAVVTEEAFAGDEINAMVQQMRTLGFAVSG